MTVRIGKLFCLVLRLGGIAASCTAKQKTAVGFEFVLLECEIRTKRLGVCGGEGGKFGGAVLCASKFLSAVVAASGCPAT